jgi:hypothetical protein
MDGLFNDTTQDIIPTGGILLAIIQIVLAFRFRVAAPPSVSTSVPAQRSPSPFRFFFSIAAHRDVWPFALGVTCFGLISFASSIGVAHYLNLDLPNATLDTFHQVQQVDQEFEAGQHWYLAGSLLFSSGFQGIALSGFAGLSEFGLGLDTYSIKSWRTILRLISVGYLVLLIAFFRVPYSPVFLQVFALAQMWALCTAFVLFTLVPLGIEMYLRIFPDA